MRNIMHSHLTRVSHVKGPGAPRVAFFISEGHASSALRLIRNWQRLGIDFEIQPASATRNRRSGFFWLERMTGSFDHTKRFTQISPWGFTYE